MLNLLSKLQFY